VNEGHGRLKPQSEKTVSPRPAYIFAFVLTYLPSCAAMKRSKQPPYDRILWTLVSLIGKIEGTELRRRTKLTSAELEAILDKLVKDDKISIIPRGTQGPNQAVIVLKFN